MTPELRAKVLASVGASPSPPRAARRRHDVLALGVGVLVAALVFVAIGGVTVATRTLSELVVPATGWALLAFVASFASVSRGGSMLGRTTRLLALVAALTAPVIYAWVSGFTAAMSSFGDAAPWNANLGCFVATLALSTAPFVAFGVLRRGSDPIHPRALGAALGAAAGAGGGVLIDLHCPVSHWVHVAFAHVLPIVIFALVGALAGKRVFGVR